MTDTTVKTEVFSYTEQAMMNAAKSSFIPEPCESLRSYMDSIERAAIFGAVDLDEIRENCPTHFTEEAMKWAANPHLNPMNSEEKPPEIHIL